MSGMSRYYVSRASVCVAFGGLLALTGSPWWAALLVGTVVFAVFLYVPHSGRYAVHPDLGATALRRDERTQTIADKAARNAFVATMLAMAGVAIYYGAIASTSVPVAAIDLILVLAALTYFLSDFWMRRS